MRIEMSLDPSIPPPLYPLTQHVPNPPQILIIPATDSLRFQQGFLGADGERAAIEGELQLKETDEIRWRKVSVLIRVLAFLYPLTPTFSFLKDDEPSYRRSCIRARY
jgi:hypothetical protein